MSAEDAYHGAKRDGGPPRPPRASVGKPTLGRTLRGHCSCRIDPARHPSSPTEWPEQRLAPVGLAGVVCRELKHPRHALRLLFVGGGARHRPSQTMVGMLIPLATALVLSMTYQSPSTDRDLAEQLARSGRTVEALAIFERIVAEHPADVEVRLWIARLQLRIGRMEEAEAGFRALVLEHPSDVDARIGLGAALTRRDAWQEALAILIGAEQDAGENADLFGALARAYRRAGDDRRALEYLQTGHGARTGRPGRGRGVRSRGASVRLIDRGGRTRRGRGERRAIRLAESHRSASCLGWRSRVARASRIGMDRQTRSSAAAGSGESIARRTWPFAAREAWATSRCRTAT